MSWLANAALLLLCCFLVADAANAVFAAVLEPPPAAAGAAAAPAAGGARSWSDRQVILVRNLFDASLVTPAAPAVAEEEDLEATKLPLTLLGTVASPNPALAWAAVHDDEKREHLVLRVDDEVRSPANRVVRIERRRIVISENGALRELALREAPKIGVSPSRAAASRRTRRTAARGRSPRRPAEGLSRPAIPAPGRNPAQLLQGADIQASYDAGGQVVGLQVNSLQAGSFLQQSGLRDGDVIKVVNGVEFKSLEDTPRMFMELAEADDVTLTVERADGSRETLAVSLPER